MRSAVIAAALVLCAPVALARTVGDDEPERPPLVDPYTRGERAAFDRCGYVSLGPFPWCGATTTRDVEADLGGEWILWVETDHLRIGSTLREYRPFTDHVESKQLESELAELGKKLPRVLDAKRRIDPWLRLHLYAARLEGVWKDFTSRFDVAPDDFSTERGRNALGEGPHLGMHMKPTVMLAEKTSTVARFVGRFDPARQPGAWRLRLPGGSSFCAASTEALRSWGYELDAALHAHVASELALNLTTGLGERWCTFPAWFESGLASFYARRADERFVLHARGVRTRLDDDSWKWDRRVRALAANRVIPSFATMLGWRASTAIDAAGHLAAWSRVDWLVAHADVDRRELLVGLLAAPRGIPEAELAEHTRRAHEATLRRATGKSLAELDAAWLAHVNGKTPKR